MISLVRQRMLHPTIGYQMVRTLLTSQQIGMDKFLNNREVNVRANKDSLISNIKNALENNTLVYSDDLKSFAHSVDTPEDAKLLKDAFVKFAQNSEPVRLNSFKIGPVITRAFYHIDDLDSLSELVNNETTAGYFQLRSAYVLYMNFLFKKEKFEQLLDYGEKAIAKILENQDRSEFFRSPESDNSLILYLAAGVKLGTEEALNRARTILHSYTTKLNTVTRNRQRLRLKQVMLFHLLCVKNGKLSEALEVLSEFYTPHYEFLNVKAGLLARLGRMEDCSFAIDSIVNDTTGRPKYVFTETIEMIRGELEKHPHDGLKAKLDSLDKELLLDAQIEDRIFALPNSTYNRSTGFNRRNDGQFDRRSFDGRAQFGNRAQFAGDFNTRFNRPQFGQGGGFGREDRPFDNRQVGNFNRFGDRSRFNDRPRFGDRPQFGNRFNRFEDGDDGGFAESSRRPFRPFQTRFKEETSDII